MKFPYCIIEPILKIKWEKKLETIYCHNVKHTLSVWHGVDINVYLMKRARNVPMRFTNTVVKITKSLKVICGLLKKDFLRTKKYKDIFFFLSSNWNKQKRKYQKYFSLYNLVSFVIISLLFLKLAAEYMVYGKKFLPNQWKCLIIRKKKKKFYRLFLAFFFIKTRDQTALYDNIYSKSHAVSSLRIHMTRKNFFLRSRFCEFYYRYIIINFHIICVF